MGTCWQHWLPRLVKMIGDAIASRLNPARHPDKAHVAKLMPR
jgi:hypothetical protein